MAHENLKRHLEAVQQLRHEQMGALGLKVDQLTADLAQAEKARAEAEARAEKMAAVAAEAETKLREADGRIANLEARIRQLETEAAKMPPAIEMTTKAEPAQADAQSITQEQLNHCLFSGSIDTKTWGYHHTVALAKFFDMLAKARGLERYQLGKAIAENAGMDEAVATRLSKTIDNIAGPKRNAQINPAGIENVSDQRTKRMSDALFPLIARYAFPAAAAGSDVWKAAKDFLASDTHVVPETEQTRHRSAGMKAARAGRSDWRKRVQRDSEAEPFTFIG